MPSPNYGRMYPMRPEMIKFQEADLVIQAVDTRPPDYGLSIPPEEQDHDAGRINTNDGQAVVDLLNRSGPPADDIGTSLPSPASALPEGVFYGDLRTRGGSNQPAPSSS